MTPALAAHTAPRSGRRLRPEDASDVRCCRPFSSAIHRPRRRLHAKNHRLEIEPHGAPFRFAHVHERPRMRQPAGVLFHQHVPARPARPPGRAQPTRRENLRRRPPASESAGQRHAPAAPLQFSRCPTYTRPAMIVRAPHGIGPSRRQPQPQSARPILCPRPPPPPCSSLASPRLVVAHKCRTALPN